MSSPFIVVFRPHQRPAWAESFDSEEEFVRQWTNGHFAKSCFATGSDNAEFDMEPLTFEAAWQDVGHDLHALTRLNSKEELIRYLGERDYEGHHNKGYKAVQTLGAELGWLPEGEDAAEELLHESRSDDDGLKPVCLPGPVFIDNAGCGDMVLACDGVDFFTCNYDMGFTRGLEAESLNNGTVRLLAAAYTSYEKHFKDAVTAAETDVLGQCLDLLRSLDSLSLNPVPLNNQQRMQLLSIFEAIKVKQDT